MNPADPWRYRKMGNFGIILLFVLSVVIASLDAKILPLPAQRLYIGGFAAVGFLILLYFRAKKDVRHKPEE